jgi:hypothetical protein
VIPLPVAIRYAYNVGITGEVNFYITGVVNFYSAGVVNFYSAGVVKSDRKIGSGISRKFLLAFSSFPASTFPSFPAKLYLL